MGAKPSKTPTGRIVLEFVTLPAGWTWEKGSFPTEITLVKPDDYANQYATISWAERTVTLGLSKRFRRYREEVPTGKGWRTKLVEMAVRELSS